MNALGRFAKFPAVGAEKYAMNRVVLGVAWLGMGQGAAPLGKARWGGARHGSEQGVAVARLGNSWQGRSRRGKARNTARHGSARLGEAWLGRARHGKARNKAGRSKDRLGGVRHGVARCGMATWVRR